MIIFSFSKCYKDMHFSMPANIESSFSNDQFMGNSIHNFFDTCAFILQVLASRITYHTPCSSIMVGQPGSPTIQIKLTQSKS